MVSVIEGWYPGNIGNIFITASNSQGNNGLSPTVWEQWLQLQLQPQVPVGKQHYFKCTILETHCYPAPIGARFHEQDATFRAFPHIPC